MGERGSLRWMNEVKYLDDDEDITTLALTGSSDRSWSFGS